MSNSNGNKTYDYDGLKNVNPLEVAKMVKCNNGTFVGKETDGLIIWKGIPYATQPVGKLRWKKALPAADDAGDEYIKEASRIICGRFRHSPVYRIGGDEFVAILTGEDLADHQDLLTAFEREMDENIANGKITIASGYACYDPAADKSYQSVFKRADEHMYQRKNRMKHHFLKRS